MLLQSSKSARKTTTAVGESCSVPSALKLMQDLEKQNSNELAGCQEFSSIQKDVDANESNSVLPTLPLTQSKVHTRGKTRIQASQYNTEIRFASDSSFLRCCGAGH